MRIAALFLLLFGTWLAWSGLYKPLLVSLGAASCLLCVWVAVRMREAGRQESGLAVARWALVYLPWLLKEIALANWQVIRIVLSPRLPVHPVLVRVKAGQRTELGRVIYGNSITLTPGTLTVDVDDDQLTVHALTHRGAAQLGEGEMNERVARLESNR